MLAAMITLSSLLMFRDQMKSHGSSAKKKFAKIHHAADMGRQHAMTIMESSHSGICRGLPP